MSDSPKPMPPALPTHPQLEAANRSAAVGSTVGSTMHEINNALAVLLANAPFVRKTLENAAQTVGDPSPTLKTQLGDAVIAQADLAAAANRIRDFIADLQGFARPTPKGDLGADVRRAIDWAVRSTQVEVRRRAKFETKIGDLPKLVADEGRLGQVVVNLLLNAAQAIPPGKAQQHVVRLEVGTRANGPMYIAVSDTGEGIKPEVRARLFEPFFTTRPTGSGLGLYVAQQSVAKLGGTIEVDSAPGTGSTFRVLIPMPT